MLNRKINQGQGQRRIEGLLRGVAWEVPLRSLRRGTGHRKIQNGVPMLQSELRQGQRREKDGKSLVC